MTLREFVFTIGFREDRNSRKKAEESINKLKNLATKALGGIGIFISVAGLASLAQAAADAEALASQFKQVFGDLEDEATKSLGKIADDTGVAVNRMKGSFTQIAAFAKTTGMETQDALDLTNRAMKAVADSSAFYDRTLEQTTESLQSFLKGNFANDAALGLSCTETTRNAAAMELFGKKYKELTEQQKQLTLLKMVEDANKLSGALGQAQRESDTWTNQLGNMKQSFTDLKAALGSTFLKPAVALLKSISALTQAVTKKIRALSSTIEERTEILKRKLNEVKEVLRKVSVRINEVADMFGGWQKIMRVLAIAVGLVVGAFAFKRIISGIKGIIGLLNPATFKLMAIVAVVLLLAAIVDDFVNFMKGNDSVIGELFEKAGIDADDARQNILEAWEKIKQGLLTVWEFLKSVGQTVFNTIKELWEKHGEDIKTVFRNLWNAVVAIAKVLVAVLMVVFEGLKAFWDRWGGTIIQYFTDVWNTLTSLIEPFLNGLNGLLTFIQGVFSGNWSQAWEGIKQMFSAVWEYIVNLFNGVVTTLVNLGSNIFGPLLEKIKTGFEDVKAWFGGLPDMAKTWMHDFVKGLIDGIKEKISGFVDEIKGIGEEIKSFLHFSVPDKGPLTDYETWMPDFMQGMAKGIKNNMPLIRDAVKSASDVLAGMGNATINGKTAINAIGGNAKTNNVNQKNEYNITVTGTDPQAVNNAANTIKGATGDTTGALANALAYGI